MTINNSYQRPSSESRRKGAIVVLAALMLIVILGFTAFSIDIGFLTLTRTQLQAAADSAALSAAMELTSSNDPATVRSNAAAAANQVAGMFENGDRGSVALLPSRDVFFGKQILQADGTYLTTWGNDQTPYNVVKVKIARSQQTGADGKASDDRIPLFFAPAMGTKSASIGVEAIASFQPRDIMVVLDFSASMNDDSCLGAIAKLGRTAVETNLLKMWQELGSPVYGNLDFTPEYATLVGAPATSTTPHNEVTYRRSEVDITSTGTVKQAVLKFSNGATETISGLATSLITLKGSGWNSGATITSVSLDSTATVTTTTTTVVKKKLTTTTTSTVIGGVELFEFTAANIKASLGLTTTYPYPGGSWDDYISKVQASSGAIKDAGYRDMYGGITFLHYLQYYQPEYSNTPDLWKTSEQPVTCLKDGVDLFMDDLLATSSGDYVGLSVYTHTSTAGAVLEHGLSNNLTQIKTTTRHRQAGHYVGGTNISAGMKVARDEFTRNSRLRAVKWMILMTDGQANMPGTMSYAAQCVIDEAYAAKSANIKILTVTVGLDADTNLMQQVADITGGQYFQVRGDQSIDDVKAALLSVFHKIAASRPLKLLK